MASKPFGGTGQTVRGATTIGGTDGMHVKNDKHPFEISGATGGRGSSKFGKSTATGPTAASRTGFQSANASLKTKHPLNGKGQA